MMSSLDTSASKRQTHESGRTHHKVRDDFVELPMYRLLTRGRLRIVLEGIESALRTPKSEASDVPRGLTIEHVMPQSWREHWAMTAETDEALLVAALARDRLVHTIGNLTLVNERLNPALSNSPWPKKRAALAEHSVLYLNKMLLADAGETWNEDAIRTRSEELFATATIVWPSAGQV